MTSGSLLTNRGFVSFQLARFLLTIGIQMQSVAVAWHVYDLTKAPLALGFVGLAQFLPLAGLSPITGLVADRFDRRNVLLVCYVGILASSVSLTLGARLHAPVTAIYAALVLFGASRAFAGSAAPALLTHLVPTSDFSRAVAWSSTTWEVASIVGPGLGGLVYALPGGAATVFGATSACTLLAFFFLLSLKVHTGRMERAEASLATLLAGVKFVWKKKVILGTISLDLFAVLLGGAVALLPIFARDVLHTGPRGLGLLRSAPAAGALTMAVILGMRPLRRRAGALMLVCVAIFGAATVVFALSQNFVLSLVALVVMGASDMVSVVIRSTLVQIATPPEMRGRVSAVNGVFVSASNELGEFESGITAAWLGAVNAAAVGGLLTLVVVATWALAFPTLRKVDRLEAAGELSTDDEPAAA